VHLISFQQPLGVVNQPIVLEGLKECLYEISYTFSAWPLLGLWLHSNYIIIFENIILFFSKTIENDLSLAQISEQASSHTLEFVYFYLLFISSQ
jgi:hypothetical protein